MNTDLSESERAAIGAHWARRATSELQVGRAFAAMVPLLRDHGAPSMVLEMLARGAADEERHSGLCLGLAGSYTGTTHAPPELGAVPLPRFGAPSEELELALLVAGMCCVNETIATAWLGASLAAATAPIAVNANRIHLQDEIDHARLGWAYLATLSDATKRALAPCLPRLLEANLPGWERDDPDLPRRGIPSHGHLPAETSRRVVRDALRELVIPGFAHVGVDVRLARAWVSRHTAP